MASGCVNPSDYVRRCLTNILYGDYYNDNGYIRLQAEVNIIYQLIKFVSVRSIDIRSPVIYKP